MKRALIVVDTQVDFCEGGSLPVRGGNDAAEMIVEYLALSEGYYDFVVNTLDLHEDPGNHFVEWPPHCVIGTPGAEQHPALAEASFDSTFAKGRFSAAYSGFEGQNAVDMQLGTWLEAHEVSMIDVVGLALDYCVRATALDGRAAGLQARVLLGLTAAVNTQSGEQAVAELIHQGVETG